MKKTISETEKTAPDGTVWRWISETTTDGQTRSNVSRWETERSRQSRGYTYKTRRVTTITRKS